jgi:hypothetical protein
MVDNIAKSIELKPFASTSAFSALWGSGVPIFRADAEGPSGGLAVASLAISLEDGVARDGEISRFAHFCCPVAWRFP